MVASDGYLKIGDYNLSKLHTRAEHLKKMYHRLHYVAPELLVKQVENAKSLDWWALGILTYELLMGFPPFMALNKQKLSILIKDTNVIFPDSKRFKDMVLTDDCKDLITRLLHKDPTKRLGCKNGYTNVLGHVWFSDLDINDIQSKKQVSPYRF